MEYYIISLIASIIIFIIIQIVEYNKNNDDINQEQYSLFRISNILLFLIIYIVFTIASFYLKPTFSTFFINNNKIDGGNNDSIKDDIDPKVLSKINDNFATGFAPFNSDDDASSVSSLNSN